MGWTAEIEIPLHTINFDPNASSWGINFQRTIRRKTEETLWSGWERNQGLTYMATAGRLEGLEGLSQGLRLDLLPYAVGSSSAAPGRGAPASVAKGTFGGDIVYNVTSGLRANLSINTDFAETEVDQRQVNLTRFPLFFPEKRTFFLEGDDIFSFGLGLDQDVIPYFSRRIGLVDDHEVPVLAGGKVNGRIGDTNFGGVAIGTRPQDRVIDDHTFMGVGRVKRNRWRESWVGAIATVGDPLGRSNSWLAGPDVTFQTSHFRGDKNLRAGAWEQARLEFREARRLCREVANLRCEAEAANNLGLAAITTGDEEAYEEGLRVHISRLRSKIESNPSKPVYIQTKRGVGYRFSAKVNYPAGQEPMALAG